MVPKNYHFLVDKSSNLGASFYTLLRLLPRARCPTNKNKLGPFRALLGLFINKIVGGVALACQFIFE
jgi:hypothetical protein